ncbi:putative monooxygenase [Cercospora zeina]
MSDEPVGSRPRVLVIGAGSAGLLTAHALQMKGARVTVYEQDASLDARPRDWNFGIYWAQVPLQECLPEHLAKQVEDAQVDDYRAGEDEVMSIYNGKTGELLRELPAPYNIRLARKRFLRLISQDVDIQWNKKLTHVSSCSSSSSAQNDTTKTATATATFSDGTTATGNLLIGAEGAHSLVRDFLLSSPSLSALQPSPLVSSVAMAKLPSPAAQKFQSLSRRQCIAFHPSGYFNWLGIHDAHGTSPPGEWTFMMIMSWIPSDPSYDVASISASRAAILQDLKSRAAEFSPEFQFLWQSIPEGTPCWHHRLSYWIPRKWDHRNGTVTLVGDSAHPMTFHRGQGLNNAILDVGSLAQRIGEKGFTAEAIEAYEREMIPRAQEAVKTSNENSEGTHDWEKLMQSPLMKMGLKQK